MAVEHRGERVMKGPERRREIIRLLEGSAEPLKGAELASRFEVSRQVIVQDLALLRAEGMPVVATPRGYLTLETGHEPSLIKTVATRHTDYPSMEKELLIFVEEGARVLNVIVEHPLYGEITGSLMITTKRDVRHFMEKIRESGGEPLASLTAGVHLHRLEGPDESSWRKICSRLEEIGCLAAEE